MITRRPGWDDDADIDCLIIAVAMVGTGLAVIWAVGWAVWSVIA